MNKPFDDKVPAYRAAALELSEAIAIASRIVTKHHPLFEELEEVDLEVGDNPAAFALQGLVIAITEADSVLTAIRDRLGAPEWLAAEEGCEA